MQISEEFVLKLAVEEAPIVARIARELGVETATPAEARVILGLRQR